jgi:signal transduction histidine kinase
MTTRAHPRAWDLLLTALLLGAALLVHATAYDAVPANLHPDALSFVLTAAAILPVAVRRLWPLAALLACFPGLLLLMALHYPVGTSVLGVEVAFYTVVAWGSRREARWGVLVLAAGLAATAALDPFDLSAEGVAVNVAVLVGGWILGTGSRDRRERHAVDVARARAEARAERDRAARASAEERLRITRELHDVIGHALSVMVVQAGVAEHLMDSRPADARRAVRAVMDTGRGSLTEMRRMLGVLRDEPRDEADEHGPAPGLSGLPALVERVERAGLPVTLAVTTGGVALPEGLELAAFRIVQEALTNSLKHARAGRADVRIAGTPSALEIEVTDDGTAPAGDAPGGHTGPAGDAPGGHGLIGMRERVAVYLGDFEAGPLSGGGFRVRARLPLHTAAAVAAGEPTGHSEMPA